MMSMFLICDLFKGFNLIKKKWIIKMMIFSLKQQQ